MKVGHSQVQVDQTLMALVMKENVAEVELYRDNFNRIHYSFERFFKTIGSAGYFPEEIYKIIYSFNEVIWEEHVNARDANGKNALMVAATKVRMMVPVLLKVGANPLAWVYQPESEQYVTVLAAVKPLFPDVMPLTDPGTLTILEEAAQNCTSPPKPQTVPLKAKIKSTKKSPLIRSASLPAKPGILVSLCAKFILFFSQ